MMSGNPQVTLDRTQRMALRRELALEANSLGDVPLGFEQGDREAVQWQLRKLRRLIAAMDVIGWTEQPDAPDKQPVQCGRSLSAWARREAKALHGAFSEFEPEDEDLDAYGALCVLGNREEP
jgi:hypothetical protein